jgi:tRNA-specific 2-thiouridylase
MLGRREIDRTRLPIGEMTKAEVRVRAHELGLRTAAKPESMDVCFITSGGRAAFLGSRIERRPGALVDADGAVVGAHDGIDKFTIGQRRGTGVAAGERRYVVDIAPATATVTLGRRAELLRDRIQLRDLKFLTPPPAGVPMDVIVQTRAHSVPVAARLEGDTVVFDTPQARVAPGQVVACYDGDVLLGGGIAAI